jgi:hypothetical protein
MRVDGNTAGELGGHSLLAGRLLGKLRDAFGKDFQMQAVFDHPTVRQFAAQLDGAEAKIDAVPRQNAAAIRTEKTAMDVQCRELRIPIEAIGQVELAGRLYESHSFGSPAPVIVDFAPYPFTYMTSNVDAATFPTLVSRAGGLVRALRVAARGFDNSGGVCQDPYAMETQRDDLRKVRVL